MAGPRGATRHPPPWNNARVRSTFSASSPAALQGRSRSSAMQPVGSSVSEKGRESIQLQTHVRDQLSSPASLSVCLYTLPRPPVDVSGASGFSLALIRLHNFDSAGDTVSAVSSPPASSPSAPFARSWSPSPPTPILTMTSARPFSAALPPRQVRGGCALSQRRAGCVRHQSRGARHALGHVEEEVATECTERQGASPRSLATRGSAHNSSARSYT